MNGVLWKLIAVWCCALLCVRAQDTAEEAKEVATATGLQIESQESEHFVFLWGAPRAAGQPSVIAAEAAWSEFSKMSGVTDAGLLFGTRKPLVGLFAAKTGYDKYADWYDAKYKPYPGFAENVKRAVFWPQPTPRIATFTHLKPNTPESARNIFAHEIGHLLVMRWKYHNNFLPPWFEEGFACWIEAKALGRNNCYCFSGGYGDRATRLDKINDIEWPKWKAAVAQQVKGKSDKALRNLVPMPLSDLAAPEMGKAWSVVDFMASQGGEKLLLFIEKFKAHWPKDIVFEHNAAKAEAQEKALNEVFGKDFDSFDAAWRAWVLKTYSMTSAPVRK
ncbi:MAG: hypothetical protein EXS14_00230 [Planctomycetes bacterium]|nr:hypothetical protein [Planctomycetota bacterium]